MKNFRILHMLSKNRKTKGKFRDETQTKFQAKYSPRTSREFQVNSVQISDEIRPNSYYKTPFEFISNFANFARDF